MDNMKISFIWKLEWFALIRRQAEWWKGSLMTEEESVLENWRKMWCSMRLVNQGGNLIVCICIKTTMLCISVSLFMALEAICKQNQQYAVEQILGGHCGLHGWSASLILQVRTLRACEHHHGVLRFEFGTEVQSFGLYRSSLQCFLHKVSPSGRLSCWKMGNLRA